MDSIIIALLRGINVGGRNKLLMKDLRDLLTNLGLSDVKTYIQSGNVLFRGDAVDKLQLAQQISTAIGESHGFTPDIMLIDAAELQRAIDANPFGDAAAEPKSFHLYFLAETPDNPDLAMLEQLKTTERFQLKDKVFYLYAPDGIWKSKVAAKTEKALGVSATARNWRTVNKISDMVTTYE